MSAIEKPVLTPPVTAPAPVPATQLEHASTLPARPKWHKYATPALVLLLTAGLVVTITWNWNAWEGGRSEQITDDASVRGDLTPLSTKVAGIVRDVRVSDFQQVRKGDPIAELEDSDYLAQVAQANATVEAAKAAIENNRRQRELQDARISRALAGVEQANAQIAAAAAGEAAVQADVIRTRAERSRQQALFETRSATQQKVESAVADEERYTAQAVSRN